MALENELMAFGLPPNAARAIGGSVATGLSLTGNNSQANALALSADYNLVATSGASANSAILPSAVGASEVIIGIASAQTTANIFPAVGEKIFDAGALGAANAAVTLAATKIGYFQPAGNFWLLVRSA